MWKTETDRVVEKLDGDVGEPNNCGRTIDGDPFVHPRIAEIGGVHKRITVAGG